MEKQAEREEAQALAQPEAVQAPTAAKNYQQSKDQQRAQRKLEREVAKLEAQMESLDQQVADLQEQMTAPDVLSDYVKMQALQTQLDALNEQASAAEDAWEQASLELEDFE